MAYQVGDVVNGKRLGTDNQWHRVDSPPVQQPADAASADRWPDDALPPLDATKGANPTATPAADDQPWYTRWWVPVSVALALLVVLVLVLNNRGSQQSVVATSAAEQSSAAASEPLAAASPPPGASAAPTPAVGPVPTANPAPAASSVPAVTGTPSLSGALASAAAPGPAAPAPAVPPPAPGASSLNTPVRDGAFEFTVTQVKCGQPQVGSAYLNKAAQGQFCLVSLTVANVGSKPQLFDGANQRGVDGQGRTVQADTEAAWYIEESKAFLEPMNPGSKAQGNIVFDISKTSTLVLVQLHEGATSKGATVKVS